MSPGAFNLSKQVAIVTGGAMGIGRGIAMRFVDAGARVLLVDLDEKAVRQTAKELPQDAVATFAVDVAADDAGDRMVAKCLERFGRVDVLVNNAGIYPTSPMLEMPTDVFDRVLRVNVRGLVLASRAAGKQMVKQGVGGSIINISSIDSIHPSMIGLAAYDCSKGAVNMFTRSFALEMAPHKVRVNAIAPGGITTEGTRRMFPGGQNPEQMNQALLQFAQRIPLKRMGVPDDIAYPTVFLASPAAAYVTGAILVVDGGVLLA